MGKKRLYLVFAVHNHQPVGNLDVVFTRGYEDCYGPLLDAIEQLPEGSRLSLHYSGPLIEWIDNYNPGYFKRLASLVEGGRVEMLSGGFYEPMLAALDPDDAVGQIRMMNEFLTKRLKANPRAMWLTERVWDSTLPRIMGAAGIEATMVDDHAFHLAGVVEEPVTGYWITERDRRTVKVFAIDKNLRYMIPFKEPSEVVGYLKSIYERLDGPAVIVYGDDGEKFGMWPGTKDWVVNRGYLRRLFEEFMRNNGWLQLVHISEAVQKLTPRGRIYLPESSYPEMMEWAQPTEARRRFEQLVRELQEKGIWERAKPFVKGGIWFNFLAKYTESNLMHKRGAFISSYLKQALHPGAELELLEKARREMFKAQCNCGYWHGLFGGLYLGHLRSAIYEHYAAAETLIDRAVYGERKWVDLRVYDYDADGREEVILRNPHIFMVIHPGNGGAFSEFTFKDKRFNFTNVLSRYEETYHNKVTASSGNAREGKGPVSIHELSENADPSLKQYLVYDRYPRFSGYTYLFKRPVTPQEYHNNELVESGMFLGDGFEILGHSMLHNEEARVILGTDLVVNLDTIPFGIGMRKLYALKQDGTVVLTHEITHKGTDPVEVFLGVEFNLTLNSPGDELHRLLINRENMPGIGISSMGVMEHVNTFAMEDGWRMTRIEVASARPVHLVFAPIKTVSHSEKGLEAVYQGTGFLALVSLELVPGVVATHSFTIRAFDLGGNHA